MKCNDIPVPQWWKTREEYIQSYIDNKIKNGAVSLLSVSPGKRKIWSVYYGDAEPELKGMANFNSALGAGKPEAFFRRGRGARKRPVLVILAGIHGQEVEGVAAAFSVIHLMEDGRDLEGNEQPSLLEKLKRLRLIVIPLANPDGRVRVTYDGWVGRKRDEMTLYGQGTKENGEPYGWSGSKEVHPMRGDVGFMGAYFDDNGVNMMHDEWSSPMSDTTKALLTLVRNEGPNMILNLHSSMHDPFFFPTAYIPVSAKARIGDFENRVFNAMESNGYSHGASMHKNEDGPVGVIPPAFNLNSMLYHTGVDMCLVFESPHGVTDNTNCYSCSDILKIHHLLFETAADYLTETQS